MSERKQPVSHPKNVSSSRETQCDCENCKKDREQLEKKRRKNAK